MFAGLTALEPGESITSDGGAFIGSDRDVIDHYLEVGARSHRHNGAAALGKPTAAPFVIASSTGGTIPADVTITVAYTLLDSQGGETLASPITAVTTPAPIEPPAEFMTATLDQSNGTLVASTYYYAFTLLDGFGGETTPSDYLEVVRPPGSPTAQILLAGLSSMLAAHPGAVSYRIYRAKNQQDTFDLLKAGTAATFLDDGSVATDCGVHPPTQNTTNSTNVLTITVPSGSAGVGASGVALWRLYLALDGDFTSPSLYGSPGRPVAQSSASIIVPVFAVDEGAPPDVATTVSGANPILAADVQGLNVPWIVVGSGAAFANGWTNTGGPYAPMRYRKELSTVFIDGAAASGSVGTTVFSLPEAMWPTYRKTFQRRGWSGGSATVDAYVEINPDGTVVSKHGTNVRCHFDEISFRTD